MRCVTHHFTDGPSVVLVEIVDVGRQEQPIIANIKANEGLGLGIVGVDPMGY